ncbi:MAG: hypothetical protein ACYTGB_10835 [Planctomycetota bacterium]
MFSLSLWPLYAIALVSGVIAAFLLVAPARGYMRWMKTRKDPDPDKRKKRPGLSACGAELLGGIALAAIAVAAVSLVTAVAGYQALGEKTLCAEVRASPIPGQSSRMLLEYTPVSGGKRGQKAAYTMNGDLWGVEGNVMRWSDWCRMLGLQTCFRVTRLSAKYSPPRRGAHPTEIYFGGEEHWFWKLLRSQDNRLPGVEASWFSGAHRAPVDGAVFEVYATPGGFMVKRR